MTDLRIYTTLLSNIKSRILLYLFYSDYEQTVKLYLNLLTLALDVPYYLSRHSSATRYMPEIYPIRYAYLFSNETFRALSYKYFARIVTIDLSTLYREGLLVS